MEDILQVIQDNLFAIISGTAITAFIGILYRKFVVSVIPKILIWVKKTVIVVVANAFGTEVSAENMENIDRLPFVDKFMKLANDIETQNELKLVELAQKLNSPLYSAIEKIPIEKVYVVLYEKMKPYLSNDIQEVLDIIQNMNKSV